MDKLHSSRGPVEEWGWEWRVVSPMLARPFSRRVEASSRTYLLIDPRLASLREDPRFIALTKRLGGE